MNPVQRLLKGIQTGVLDAIGYTLPSSQHPERMVVVAFGSYHFVPGITRQEWLDEPEAVEAAGGNRDARRKV